MFTLIVCWAWWWLLLIIIITLNAQSKHIINYINGELMHSVHGTTRYRCIVVTCTAILLQCCNALWVSMHNKRMLRRKCHNVYSFAPSVSVSMNGNIEALPTIRRWHIWSTWRRLQLVWLWNHCLIYSVFIDSNVLHGLWYNVVQHLKGLRNPASFNFILVCRPN